MRLLPLCCAIFALLAGCAPGHGLRPLPRIAVGDYRLGPGDSVRLTTFGEEQLTGEFRVGANGMVAVPLLGEVRAAGLTPTQLQDAVAAGLKRRNLLRDPNVAAEVVEYRPIFVLGEVNKPGQYPYQPGMTMVTAVAVAGGFTYRAVQGYASVVRTVDGAAEERKASRDAFVQPGDVLTVFERRF
ncbi:MAG TPA: polysaccharide biosynthesis/export family protein [Acetobacteraceae bacterium]|nr:polysaccharide biosynthesis/export family protein [Acetobacteraceae bacterium]